MDNSKKLNCSRCSHKSHLGKILVSTDDIIAKLSSVKETGADATLVNSEAILLAENLKQLCLKTNIFTKLDKKKIIANLEDEEKLETAVFEAADLQATISEKKAVVQHMLKVFSEDSTAVATAQTTHPLQPQSAPLPSNGSQV